MYTFRFRAVARGRIFEKSSQSQVVILLKIWQFGDLEAKIVDVRGEQKEKAGQLQGVKVKESDGRLIRHTPHPEILATAPFTRVR